MPARLRLNGQEVGRDEPVRVGSNILKRPSLLEGVRWYVRKVQTRKLCLLLIDRMKLSQSLVTASRRW